MTATDVHHFLFATYQGAYTQSLVNDRFELDNGASVFCDADDDGWVFAPADVPAEDGWHTLDNLADLASCLENGASR
jgi:hypothetical protein